LRAAHADPGATDDVVVEETDVLEDPPVDVLLPVVGGEPLPLDEHAATTKAPSTAAMTMPGRDGRSRHSLPPRRVRRGAEVLRS
jgi:hypothetical protein